MRPNDLPDYTTPPVDEVVLGLQFAAIPGYRSVDSANVWELFRDEMPMVLEQAPLFPQFETFGGQPSFNFFPPFGLNAQSPRLWFLSKDENHIVQFQPDRLLVNWRKVNGNGIYPRYEMIKENLISAFKKVDQFAIHEKSQRISINQAEISYINVIPISDFSEIGSWLSTDFRATENDDTFNFNSSMVIKGDDGNPIARLYREIQVGSYPSVGTLALRLNLTFRGKPELDSIDSAVSFINLGRISIVNEFTRITTDFAHKSWGQK